MSHYQHLTLEDRVLIKMKLEAADSFRKIAKDLGKSPTTISQEIKKHRSRIEKNAFNTRYNPCKHRFHCPAQLLCGRLYCKKKTCASCKEGCSPLCPDFEEEYCPRLQKAPYVCHGCKQKNRCGLTRYEYMPTVAHHQYLELLSESRQGRSYSPEEVDSIRKIVKADLKRGLSPYIIWANHKNELPCSHRTIYRLIQDRALAEVSGFDLPYKIRYRPRRKRREHKIDTHAPSGEDLPGLPGLHGEDPWPVVEMDTVIGTVGGKVILSLYFQESSLLLLYLRDVIRPSPSSIALIASTMSWAGTAFVDSSRSSSPTTDRSSPILLPLSLTKKAKGGPGSTIVTRGCQTRSLEWKGPTST